MASRAERARSGVASLAQREAPRGVMRFVALGIVGRADARSAGGSRWGTARFDGGDGFLEIGAVGEAVVAVAAAEEAAAGGREHGLQVAQGAGVAVLAGSGQERLAAARESGAELDGDEKGRGGERADGRIVELLG